MHYKENHRIIDTSNFKYKICMFLYTIMTCGNRMQDFHNTEVIDRSLEESMDILSLSLFKQVFFFTGHPEFRPL